MRKLKNILSKRKEVFDSVNFSHDLPNILLKSVLLGLIVISIASIGTATEIESGYVQASSTGTITEDIGFRPDYIEFITAQQIESTNFRDADPENNDCPDNVNGWSEGSVIFDDSGVDKQFSIGMFRSSDSTNGHITASSTSDVVRNVYTSQDGNNCGKLEVSVVEPLSDGFSVDVESKYNAYDEIIRYKAYQFPDNMGFDAGMVKIDSTGSLDVNGLDFQPANLHIRAGQQISSKNSINSYWRDPAGRSKGYATLDQDGNLIDQQSIGTASSSDSTNAHRSIASDEYILNTAYVDQNANLYGRLRAKVTGANSNGFSMQVDDKWSGTDEIFLYRAWGHSYYDFDIGYAVIDSQGSRTFNTGFKPDAIDIYAEQQINSINQEVRTPGNSGCDNAGGWSNGFYESDDGRQWAISTGRTSDSQDSHRYGATTTDSLLNLYNYDGNDCGNFEGSVIGTSSDGFEMDFNYDSNFNNNYGEEMVYFRAFDFQIAPPQSDNIQFTNYTGQHSFKVEANFSEGSNDIDKCEIRAEDDNGNLKVYDESDGVQAVQVTDTKSKCVYDRVWYDDISAWEDRHHQNEELLNLSLEVIAEDVDGQSASQTGYNTFPNTGPSINQLTYSNYTKTHGFNVTAEVIDQDSINPEEIKSCSFKFSDDDGNSVSKTGDIDYSYGDKDEAECSYSNVNSSMPSGVSPGFEVLENIDIEASLEDSHGQQDSMTDSHVIPNALPNAYNPDPRDEAIVTGDEDQNVYIGAEVTDSDDDLLNIYYFNDSGEFMKKVEASSGDKVSILYPSTEVGETYDWNIKVGDTYENYSSNTFSFTKTTRFAYRTKPRIEYSYSSVILDKTDTRAIRFKAENRISEPKNLVTYISGVNASFAENNQKTISYELDGNSEKEFLVTIEPTSLGDKYLNLTTENQEFGVNTSTSIPVTVKSYTEVSETSEVPGIGTIQLIMLLLVSAYLYSARL